MNTEWILESKPIPLSFSNGSKVRHRPGTAGGGTFASETTFMPLYRLRLMGFLGLPKIFFTACFPPSTPPLLGRPVPAACRVCISRGRSTGAGDNARGAWTHGNLCAKNVKWMQDANVFPDAAVLSYIN